MFLILQNPHTNRIHVYLMSQFMLIVNLLQPSHPLSGPGTGYARRYGNEVIKYDIDRFKTI